jgi:hypothetical protein
MYANLDTKHHRYTKLDWVFDLRRANFFLLGRTGKLEGLGSILLSCHVLSLRLGDNWYGRARWQQLAHFVGHLCPYYGYYNYSII